MGWTNVADFPEYREVIQEGFLLLQGKTWFGGDGSESLHLPTMAVMRVHQSYPIEFVYAGAMSLKPVGDKRMPAEIWCDPNPKVYDVATILLDPRQREDPESFLTYVGGGFELNDNEKTRTGVNVRYIIRGFAADARGMLTIAQVMPPLIPQFVYSWLYSKPEVDIAGTASLDQRSMGRVNLDGVLSRGEVTNKIVKTLEERFETKMNLR